MGAVRAQGNEIEIPTLADAKEHFDAWLLSEPTTGAVSRETVMRRALGLSER